MASTIASRSLLRALSKPRCAQSSYKPSPSTQWQCQRVLPHRFPARSFGTSRALFEKKYTKDHEWIEMSSDGKTGTIGISVYAAKNLGDVVYVELPEVSLQATRGDAIGAVESVKSASDIMTPVSGTITGVNEALQEKPALINKDPEGEGGWIARIEVDPEKGGKELQVSFQEGGEGEEAMGLMNEVEYGQFVAE